MTSISISIDPFPARREPTLDRRLARRVLRRIAARKTPGRLAVPQSRLALPGLRPEELDRALREMARAQLIVCLGADCDAVLGPTPAGRAWARPSVVRWLARLNRIPGIGLLVALAALFVAGLQLAF